MADVTIERNTELAKELALLKSRNKTLGNLVNVEKDVLIKSKEQATAMSDLGDNVKSIGNNLLSGAENITSSIFGGSLGGVLNSLTIGMVKRRNENAKIEKDKAKEEAKATEAAKVEREKILNNLVDTLKLTDEHKDKSREQLEAMIKASELEKEIAAKNEQIKKEKEEALALIGGESSFIGPLLPDGGRGGESQELEELRKIASGVETAEEKGERLRREKAKEKGGESVKVKLEGAEDKSGFSLMDIFKKGGKGKLLGSLATGLTGIASFAFSKEGGLFSAMKGVNFGKLAGAGLLAAGIVSIAADGLKGITKSKEWGVGTGDAAVGAMLGGVDSGVKGMFAGAGKYALIGAGIGSFIPGLGTLIGGLAGALIGGLLGYFGGEKIAQGIKAIRDYASDLYNSFLGLFGKDDKEQTKQKNIKELKSQISRAEKAKVGILGGSTYRTEDDKTAAIEKMRAELSTEEGRDIGQEKKNDLQKNINKLKQMVQNSPADPEYQIRLKNEEAEMMKLDPNYKPVSKNLARGGFIVNQPTYLPNSGVVVGEHGTYSGSGLAYGGIADGGPEAVIPLSSPRAGAFIDPMARSVSGVVMNQLAMARLGGGAGGGSPTVVTGNDMSSNQVNNSTTVVNNPSPIGQMLPDEGRDFVSKVA